MSTDPFGQILGRNIAAERRRIGIGQADVAERMKALGFTQWVPQTVSKSERNDRRVLAAEVVGLASCLDTTVEQLLSPRKTDPPVELPSGVLLASIQVMALVSDENNGPTNRGTRWVGNTFEQGWPVERVRSWGTGFPREG